MEKSTKIFSLFFVFITLVLFNTSTLIGNTQIQLVPIFFSPFSYKSTKNLIKSEISISHISNTAITSIDLSSKNQFSKKNNYHSDYKGTFFIGGTYGLVSPEGINDFISGINGEMLYYTYTGNVISSDPPFNLIENIIGAESELKVKIGQLLSLKIGAIGLKKELNEERTIIVSSSIKVNWTDNIEATVVAPYVGAGIDLGSDFFTLEVFSDIGYFYGKFSMNYEHHSYTDHTEFVHSKDDYGVFSKTTIGYMFGGRAMISILGINGIFIEGKYVKAMFDQIEATFKLYHYNNVDSIKHVQLNNFDFSGSYITMGLFIRF